MHRIASSGQVLVFQESDSSSSSRIHVVRSLWPWSLSSTSLWQSLTSFSVQRAHLRQYPTRLFGCQPIASSLTSGIEHSDRTHTLLPHVIQEYFVCLSQLLQENDKLFLQSAMAMNYNVNSRRSAQEEFLRMRNTWKARHGSLRARQNKLKYIKKVYAFIRRDACATLKLKRRYQYFIRLTKTDKTSWTNLIYQTDLIRFRRRAIVEFNCLWDLEWNSSKLNSTVARRIN